MPQETKVKVEEKRWADLTAEKLLQMYRFMYTSRRTDDMEMKLKRQTQVYFQIAGAGHEAILVACGMVLKPGYDWFYGYYRDKAFVLTWGITPYEMFLDSVGSGIAPASGGRQMPAHWSNPKLHIVTQGSPVGTQFLQAVGSAQAGRVYGNVPQAGKAADFHKDEIILVTGGEGATSEGEFFEALNRACIEAYDLHLPMLFLIEDNGYAISVPVEVQTAGGSITKFLSGLAESNLLLIRDVDGCDPIASYQCISEVATYIRKTRKPALVKATTIRPYSHSESDDDKLYRPEFEREEDKKKDPLVRFPEFLLKERIATEAELEKIRNQVDQELEQASEKALAAPKPDPKTATVHLYSEKIDPASKQFESTPQFSGDPKTMIESINHTLSDEMERNPKIVVFGEDVADCTREQYLDKVPGKGGVFKATVKLQRKYGSHRVFNTALAEATIIGTAIGMAVRGLKPVPEIQFGDYIWPSMMQIVNELAKFRWRSNGAWSAAAVVRVAVGGYLGGSGAIYHSQSIESTFAHFPGLRIVLPSTALDACGLLRTALRSDDPVLFLEHKRLYREPALKSPYPGPDFTIPFGKGKVLKEGKDLSIITYGALTLRSLDAQRILQTEGIDIEIIDLRSILPWDKELVAQTVKKTGRVIVAYEDTLTMGFGAEVSAWISEHCFEYLDAPVVRVAALDTPVSYGPWLEKTILPQTENIVEAVKKISSY